jgi:hypothetical protein
METDGVPKGRLTKKDKKAVRKRLKEIASIPKGRFCFAKKYSCKFLDMEQESYEEGYAWYEFPVCDLFNEDLEEHKRYKTPLRCEDCKVAVKKWQK